MKRILFLFLLFTKVAAFGQVKTDEKKEIAKSYDLSDLALDIWRSDSTGCLGRRLSVADTLFSKNEIIGMSKDHFVLLFGRPNSVSEEAFLYYQVGIFCNSELKREHGSSGWSIIVEITNNKVSRYFEEIIE